MLITVLATKESCCGALSQKLLPPTFPTPQKTSSIIPQAESELLPPGAQQIEVDKEPFQLSVVSWVSVWGSAVALMRELSQPCDRGKSLLLPYVNQSHFSVRSFVCDSGAV